ncbi:MAG: sugar O-acetyltransferase [Anaerolineales bacterium]
MKLTSLCSGGTRREKSELAMVSATFGARAVSQLMPLLGSGSKNQEALMPVRTEKEKMVAGERYNCLDPDLEIERQKVKKSLRRYNLTESLSERKSILQQLFGQIGKNSIIEPPFYCVYGQNIYIGDNVFLNIFCNILDCNKVCIGHHVMIGPSVQIYTAAHDIQAETRNQGWEVAKPIEIEDNVWIGGSAILLPGVRIGKNAVVGAGAVVSRSVPANTVVAGNPAKVIREIEQ